MPDPTTESATFVSPITSEIRHRLKALHKDLLRLHKVLMDNERVEYEKVNGAIPTSGEMLRLVMYDPWFDWLHRISELLVQIDELLDDKEATLDGAYQILAATRSLFKSNPEDPAFGAKYRACLQREPAAVLAHADVQRVLFADS